MIIIGIDPGASGGIAVQLDGIADTHKMPQTERDVFDLLMSYRTDNTFAYLEKVGGFVRGNKAPGSAMFNFGKTYGALLMALTAATISFEEVMPNKWQKMLGIPKRKKEMSRTEWKNTLKRRAQQLFPQANVTLSTCDALLICEYGRRLRSGELKEPRP